MRNSKELSDQIEISDLKDGDVSVMYMASTEMVHMLLTQRFV